MRIAQAENVGGQEGGGRHLARPVEREGIHRLDHAVAHAVEQFEIADQFLRREGLELKLAAGFVLDRAAPFLEGLEPDAGRPGGLHFHRRRGAGLGVGHVRRGNGACGGGCAGPQYLSARERNRLVVWQSVTLPVGRSTAARLRQKLACQCKVEKSPMSSGRRAEGYICWRWRSLGDSNPCFRRERATS